VDYASRFFSEEVTAAFLADANTIFDPQWVYVNDDTKGEKRTKAIRRALSAWLNFASGAVVWDEMVSMPTSDGGPRVLVTFNEAMAQVEDILLDLN
jgi:hypothetical protein